MSSLSGRDQLYLKGRNMETKWSDIDKTRLYGFGEYFVLVFFVCKVCIHSLQQLGSAQLTPV